jgi:putative transposase
MVSDDSLPVARRSYRPDDRIGLFIGTAKAVWYRCVETNPAGHRFQRLDDPTDTQTFTHEDVAEFERSEGYRYVPKGQDLGRMLARKRGGVDALMYLPEKDRSIVTWRLAWVEAFLAIVKDGKASRSEAGLNGAIALIADDMEKAAKKRAGNRAGATVTTIEPPGYKTLLKWVVDFEAGGKDPLALRNGHRHCGKNYPKISGDIEALMDKFARKYLTSTKRTMAEIFGEFEDAVQALKAARTEDESGAGQLKTPCDKTFFSRIDRLRAFDVSYARNGKGRSRKKYFAVWEHITALMPGERIELDEWELPLQTLLVGSGAWEKMTKKQRKAVERARLWVSVAIDVSTRCILGMLLSLTPTAHLAVRTIAMCFTDKTRLAASAGAVSAWHMCAGMGTLVTDQGSAYVAEVTRFAVVACGGNLYHPPGGLAQHRPYIERFFGSVHTRLISLFTGRTFEDIKAKGDYDAVGNASLVLTESIRVLVRHVVDDYHNTEHPGLDGETPARAWERITEKYGTVPLPAPRTIRNVFGEERQCATGPRGVRCNNRYYQSHALQQYRREFGDGNVRVLFDPENLGYVSVLIGDEDSEDGGWLTVPCAEPGYDGVRAEDHLRKGADRRLWLETEHAEDKDVARKARAAARALAAEAADRARIRTVPDDAELRHATRALDFGRVSSDGEDHEDLFADLIVPPTAHGARSPEAIVAAPVAASRNPTREGRNRPSMAPSPPARNTSSNWTIED